MPLQSIDEVGELYLSIPGQKEYSSSFVTINELYLNASSILPFRVSFTNEDPSNPQSVAPIGIAIIGVNNYIL